MFYQESIRYDMCVNVSDNSIRLSCLIYWEVCNICD